VTRFVAVAGTDTGVGKTVLTAALATHARASGARVAVVKPVQTGAGPGEPGDLDEVRRLSGVEDLHELARLREPLAPATAARRAGVALPTVGEIADRVRALSDRDVVLVEGAGGLLVELDDGGGTLADLAAGLGAPVVVVARPGLGTLNATALTCEALRHRGLHCLGVVIGSWPAEPDLAAECNVDDLPGYAGVPLLGRVPEGAGELGPEEFLDATRAAAGAILQDLTREPLSKGH
jgi:dethiobiotin synthetase